MKKLLLSLLCGLALNVYAQDTVKKTNSVGKFEEQFMVLKSDKKVRQGSYQLLSDKKVVARGHYDQGKRVGLWSFYNNGTLEQQYDYTANKLVLNVPYSGTTCEIEDAQTGDDSKSAIKIGGYSSIEFMVANAKINEGKLGDVNKITHVIALDANGRITSWSASISNSDGVNIVHPEFAELANELTQFIPATLNGKKASCTVSIRLIQQNEDNGALSPNSIKVHNGKKSKNTP